MNPLNGKGENEKPKLVIGNKYMIDKEAVNGGEVVLVQIYGNHFCRVADPDDGVQWDTMLYRLSEIDSQLDSKPKGQ